ncbi:MAG: hypothetical protein AAFV53_09365 [Myxococcota bacterium]
MQHVRIGDRYLEGQQFQQAYDAYAIAVQVRPESARAQERLRSVRGQLLDVLDMQIEDAIRSKRFDRTGQILREVDRFDPPADWIAGQRQRVLDAISAEAAHRLGTDDPRVVARWMGQTRNQHPANMSFDRIEIQLAEALIQDAQGDVQKNRFAAARDRLVDGQALLPAASSRLGEAISVVHQQWATDLRTRSSGAARAGDVGQALLWAAGAASLSRDAADQRLHQDLWASLLKEEWRGVSVGWTGQPGAKNAVKAGLVERWAASGWQRADWAPSRKATITGQVRLIADGCARERVAVKQKVHNYTDGTMIPNPRIPTLQEQLQGIIDARAVMYQKVTTSQAVVEDRRVEASRRRAEYDQQYARTQDAQVHRDAAEQRLIAAERSLQIAVDATAMLQTLEGERRALRDAEPRLVAQHDRLNDAVIQARAEREDARNTLRVVQTGQQQLNGEFQSATDRVRDLEQEREALSAGITTLDRERTRLQGVKQQSTSKQSALDSKLRYHQGLADTARRELEAIEREIATVSQRLDAARARVREPVQRLDELDQSIKTLKARLARMEQQLADVNEQLESDTLSEEDRVAAAERKERLTTRQESAGLRLTKLVRSRPGVQGEVDAARDDAAALQAELYRLQPQLEAKRQASQSARQAVERARQALDEERAAAQQAESQLPLLSAQRAEKQTTLRQIEQTALPRAQRRVYDTRSALQAKKVEVDQAERQLASRQQALEQAKVRLVPVRQELRAVQERRAALPAEIQSARLTASELPAREAARRDALRNLEETEGYLAQESEYLSQAERGWRTAAKRRDSAISTLNGLNSQANALTQRAERVQSALSAEPAQVEMVKAARYSQETWQQTCTIAANLEMGGWSHAFRFEQQSQDTTHRERPSVGLVGDPLAFSVDGEAALAQGRSALIETLWSGVVDQMGTLQTQWASPAAGASVEAATRGQLMAAWASPGGALTPIFAEHYDLPPEAWAQVVQ